MYSIRILNPNGTFQAFLSHNNKTAWSKRQAQRHAAHARTLPHFKHHTLIVEPN
jgi:hypothetical protein